MVLIEIFLFNKITDHIMQISFLLNSFYKIHTKSYHEMNFFSFFPNSDSDFKWLKMKGLICFPFCTV